MALHNALTVLWLTTRVLWQCKSCTGEPKRDLALVPKAEAGRFARRLVTTASGNQAGGRTSQPKVSIFYPTGTMICVRWNGVYSLLFWLNTPCTRYDNAAQMHFALHSNTSIINPVLDVLGLDGNKSKRSFLPFYVIYI
jgi:hypothetical protein